MRCPYCRQTIRVQGRFCPKCGQQIFGLPVRSSAPAEPGAPASGPLPPAAPLPVTPPANRPPDLSGDTVEIEVEPDTRASAPWAPPAPVGAHAAAGDEVGKTCPYCRFPVKPGEQAYLCPACKVVHHMDCWRENQGCTTYGCRGPAAAPMPAAQPSYRAPVGAPAHPTGGVMPDFALLQARELEGRANNALWLTLAGILPCCLPLALVGLFMALGLLGEMNRMSISGGGARGKVVSAIVVAVLTMVFWIIYLVSQSRHSYG